MTRFLSAPRPAGILSGSLLAAVILGGCGGNGSGTDAGGDADSAQSPIHVMRRASAAAAKDDWAAFFHEFTPESQRRQLSAYLFLIEKQSQQAGEGCHRSFRDFLAAQKIEPQPLARQETSDELKRRFTHVTSVPRSIAALIAWIRRHKELPTSDPLKIDDYRKLGKAEFEKVAIRGDIAIVNIRLKEGHVVQMQLRNDRGEWRIDVHRE